MPTTTRKHGNSGVRLSQEHRKRISKGLLRHSNRLKEMGLNHHSKGRIVSLMVREQNVRNLEKNMVINLLSLGENVF